MSIRILTGDALTMLRGLPDASVNCCVTSPPYYGLRDYGVEGQVGLEETPDAYVSRLVEVFREVRNHLTDDGTLWLNIGDSYGAVGGDTHAGFNQRWSGTGGDGSKQDAAHNGMKGRKVSTGLRPKNLLGIPWRVAFALQADGWILRQDIIWHKPNPMPESVRDRCTKAHEYVFLLAKSSRYFYDAGAIAEAAEKGDAGSEYHVGKTAEHQLGRASTKPRRASTEVYTGAAYEHPQSEPRGPGRNFGQPLVRNKRSVWSITTQPFAEAHFATMAPELAETCIKAGTKPGDTVLDPFGGAGTTALCADRLGRNALLIELNPAYVEIARKRLSDDAGMFAEVAA